MARFGALKGKHFGGHCKGDRIFCNAYRNFCRPYSGAAMRYSPFAALFPFYFVGSPCSRYWANISRY